MYKILSIAPTPFFSDRGCHVRIYEEAKALERLGNRVEICTYSLGRDIPGLTVHRCGGIPYYSKHEAGPSYVKPALDVLLFKRIVEAARAFKPDIIHAHLHEGCFLGAMLKRMFPRPLVFDYQGSLSGESMDHGFFPPGSLRHKAMLLLERRLDSAPDIIFASSEYLRSRMAAGINAAESVVIRDSVDPGLFRPQGDSIELRKKLGIPPEARVIVYLGLLAGYQGIDILLDAARIVCARHSDAYFLVMGYPDEDLYRAKAEALGLAEKTCFTGRMDYFKASQYLSLGHVAAAPKISLSESNGKLLNYLACGLAVAAFDSPANREILKDNAAYAEPSADPAKSAANLAEKIIEILESDKLRLNLSQQGRRMAEFELSWDRTAKKMMEYYDELCGRGRT